MDVSFVSLKDIFYLWNPLVSPGIHYSSIFIFLFTFVRYDYYYYYYTIIHIRSRPCNLSPQSRVNSSLALTRLLVLKISSTDSLDIAASNLALKSSVLEATWGVVSDTDFCKLTARR